MGQPLGEQTVDETASKQAYERWSDGADVLAGLRDLPGGRELLDLASERDDVELVGGAVRDLLLGGRPRELDVVVGDEEAPFSSVAFMFARELGARLNTLAGANEHERFGTALVEWDGGRVDVAARRAESYPAPGALPDVRAGTPEEDLQRRDFTVNAIAVSLGGAGARRGALRHVPGALEDLAAGRLRVLHEQSFSDDPTRLLRLARYAARLGFEVEDRTAALAHAALAARALDTVSGARIGAELRLALSEPDALAALAALGELGVLGALHPRLRFEQSTAREALALLPDDGRPDLALLAALVLPLALRAEGDPRAEIVALLDRWEIPAGDRDRVVAAAVAVPRLIEELPAAEHASALRAVACGVPLEGVALAGALDCSAAADTIEGEGVADSESGGRASGAEEPPARRAARRWLTQTRHVRLEITGDDLLAAGIPAGPEIGRRLETVLDLRLDHQIPADTQAQLAAALQAEH
jgi:tRNA nucleotidyltransferase (CCA-adding enzyme)